MGNAATKPDTRPLALGPVIQQMMPQIAQQVGPKELHALARVNRQCRAIANEPERWKRQFARAINVAPNSLPTAGDLHVRHMVARGERRAPYFKNMCRGLVIAMKAAEYPPSRNGLSAVDAALLTTTNTFLRTHYPRLIDNLQRRTWLYEGLGPGAREAYQAFAVYGFVTTAGGGCAGVSGAAAWHIPKMVAAPKMAWMASTVAMLGPMGAKVAMFSLLGATGLFGVAAFGCGAYHVALAAEELQDGRRTAREHLEELRNAFRALAQENANA